MTQDVIEQRITAEPPLEQLPEEVPVLQQMVLTLLSDVDDLRRQLFWYKNHVFGRRSEKLDPNQPWLFKPRAQSPPHASDAPLPPFTKPTPKQEPAQSAHKGRKPLPAHLPRQRIEHHPSEQALTCGQCGNTKQPIGEEITEQLDYHPSSFFVRQHVRVKYACKACQDGVVIADLPAMPIEKGRPGEGLLAHVLTSKYADHLPLHRLEGIFQRHQVDISRATLCDWVGDCADLLKPIVLEMKRQILLGPMISTDDTPVRAQGEGGACRKVYLYVYISPAHHVVFDYATGHGRDGPMAFLGVYNGYVQADAHPSYDMFFTMGKATEVGCWGHARRPFYDAREEDPVRSAQMLSKIHILYEIEREAKDRQLAPDAIRDLRQQQAKPVLLEIKALLHRWAPEVLPKGAISKAIGYAKNQWVALNRYVEDGILSIDNNLSERTLRMVAVGRNNWLFFGADSGGERAAIIYSLVASCKLCKIDPFAYFRDVLGRINTHPASRIIELTPPHWKLLAD